MIEEAIDGDQRDSDSALGESLADVLRREELRVVLSQVGGDRLLLVGLITRLLLLFSHCPPPFAVAYILPR